MTERFNDPGRGPIAFMAGNSVAANLVMLFCLVGGLFALLGIKQEVFPDFQLDAVQVTVAYPGASPEEVEDGILLAIEEAVQDLEDIDEISSTAAEGFGTVTVELLEGSDVQKVTREIEAEVDRIDTFPEDAEEPEVRAIQFGRQVLTVAVYGATSNVSLHRLAEQVRDELLQDENITRVDLSGVPDLQIAVEVPQEQLRRYGLTHGEIARRIGDAALDIPGGGLDTPGGEVLLRVTERRDFGKEFAEIPIITTPAGASVVLGELAEIDDGFEDTDRYILYNGQPAITLDVFRVGGQTPVQVSQAVKNRLDEIRANLPAGVKVASYSDRSEIFGERVELLLRNGSIGLVLVLIVLGVFLEARLAFWVMMGIPISFLGSFLFLPMLPMEGLTINMISLFAYIISLGIVVDDAIVVGENVYHYHQEGMGFGKAAVRGAREVAMPVTFSILTNIVAFLPIVFIPGVTGKIFRVIPLVVCSVFLISLFESLFILPAHLGHQKERQRRGLLGRLHRLQQQFSFAFRRWIYHRYGPFVDLALRYRYLTLAAAVAVLVAIGAYARSGRLGFQQFPTIESDRAEARLVLPFGAPVEKTEALVRRLEAGARKVIQDTGHDELLEAIISDVGSGGSHTATVRVNLADADVRDRLMSTTKFTNAWRQAVGDVAGVESLRFVDDAGGPGSRGRSLAVELSHRSMEVLEAASKDLAATLETYPRVKDVDDGFQPGKEQRDFTITESGKSLNLTARTVARQVRDAFYGAEALSQQRGRNELEVRVRLPERQRASEQMIQDLMIRAPSGVFVPLSDIAHIQLGRAYKSIDRRQGRRVVEVSADVNPRKEAGEILADLRAGPLPELTRNYKGLTYSFQGRRADIQESLNSLAITFPVAMLAIYALLAIPFRSYVQPVIVMVSIPFGIIGAFLGHIIMGYSLSMPSLFGIVALSGVVVNDSLVLVDFANRRRRQDGADPHDAIHQAGVQRFRPVVLTTLTTFGGLAPMIFETSRQARFLIPMALSLGYGILFATSITLVLVPSLYLIVEDLRKAGVGVYRYIWPLRQMPDPDKPETATP